MRLSQPVDISDTVNVICLPPDNNFNPPTNTEVVITGFGLTSEGGRFPYTLQQAIIQLLPNCPNVYSPFDFGRQICAGLPGGGADTCQGRRSMNIRKERNMFFLY